MTRHLELIYGAVRKGLYVLDRFKLFKGLKYLDVVKIRMLTFFYEINLFMKSRCLGHGGAIQ